MKFLQFISEKRYGFLDLATLFVVVTLMVDHSLWWGFLIIPMAMISLWVDSKVEKHKNDNKLWTWGGYDY